MIKKTESMDIGQPNQKEKKPKVTNNVIDFNKFGGGRPTFSRKPKTGILDGDFESLDTIDKPDDGKKKNQKKNPTSASAADGGKEFVNYGSTATEKPNKKIFEEGKDEQ